MVKKLIYSSYLQIQPIKWVGKMKRKFKKSIFLTKNRLYFIIYNTIKYITSKMMCHAPLYQSNHSRKNNDLILELNGYIV